MNVPSIAAAAIDLVGHNSVTIVRETGSYVNGFWVPDAPGPAIIATGTITPATGKDMLRLPEGRRHIEAVRFITRSELLVAGTYGGILHNADRFDYLGGTFEVEHTAKWDGTFFDVLATRRGG